MKYYARCESRENLHDVLWCKIAQAFPLTSSANSHVMVENMTSWVACDVMSKQVFRCSSGHCVNASVVCNGITDCPDGSDEDTGSEAACDGRNNRNNVIIIVIVVVVAIVTLAALCWLASTAVDCLSHVYKHCSRCIRRHRGQPTSSSSSSFDLAASSRILRARGAFSAAAAATRGTPKLVSPVNGAHPHVVVVSAEPPSYSHFLLATAPCCEQSPCGSRCCCEMPPTRDVGSYHVMRSTATSDGMLTSWCECGEHQPLMPLLCSSGGDDRGGGGGRGGHRCSSPSNNLTHCHPLLPNADCLPPSYSAVCAGRHSRLIRGGSTRYSGNRFAL